jgi:hypothetical protein
VFIFGAGFVHRSLAEVSSLFQNGASVFSQLQT